MPPVLWCREVLAGGEADVLIVNAGNANAFTGRPGESAVVSVGPARHVRVIGSGGA